MSASAERFKAHLKRTTKYSWVMKSGRHIHPWQMEFSHLGNTLAMIRRWGRYEKFQRELFCIGAADSCGGDGAYDAVMSEAHSYMVTSDHWFCMEEVPIYRTMYEEYRSRAMG